MFKERSKSFLFVTLRPWKFEAVGKCPRRGKAATAALIHASCNGLPAVTGPHSGRRNVAKHSEEFLPDVLYNPRLRGSSEPRCFSFPCSGPVELFLS